MLFRRLGTAISMKLAVAVIVVRKKVNIDLLYRRILLIILPLALASVRTSSPRLVTITYRLLEVPSVIGKSFPSFILLSADI